MADELSEKQSRPGRLSRALVNRLPHSVQEWIVHASDYGWHLLQEADRARSTPRMGLQTASITSLGLSSLRELEGDQARADEMIHTALRTGELTQKGTYKFVGVLDEELATKYTRFVDSIRKRPIVYAGKQEDDFVLSDPQRKAFWATYEAFRDAGYRQPPLRRVGRFFIGPEMLDVATASRIHAEYGDEHPHLVDVLVDATADHLRLILDHVRDFAVEDYAFEEKFLKRLDPQGDLLSGSGIEAVNSLGRYVRSASTWMLSDRCFMNLLVSYDGFDSIDSAVQEFSRDPALFRSRLLPIDYEVVGRRAPPGFNRADIFKTEGRLSDHQVTRWQERFDALPYDFSRHDIELEELARLGGVYRVYPQAPGLLDEFSSRLSALGERTAADPVAVARSWDRLSEDIIARSEEALSRLG